MLIIFKSCDANENNWSHLKVLWNGSRYVIKKREAHVCHIVFITA